MKEESWVSFRWREKRREAVGRASEIEINRERGIDRWRGVKMRGN